MDTKVSPLLVKKEPLSEADMEKFGKKDAEAYPAHCVSVVCLSVCLSVCPVSLLPPTLNGFSFFDFIIH